VTIEGPRVLDKCLDATDIDLGDPSAFPATVNGSNWVILDNGATPTFATRSYYDLSGYNRKKLTSFFQGVEIQEGWGPRGTDDFFVVDLITTEFLDDQTLIDAQIYTTHDGDLPGFPRSTFDMSQVIYGRTREYTAATATTIANQYSEATWGTCTATTADKVHLTRVVYLDAAAAPGSKVHIPPCDYVSAIIVSEEKELAFLMRQKRSYELATGP
jgi:hypothetical protein